jgi:hypothetical protein
MSACRRCSSVCQLRAISLLGASLGLVWCSESASVYQRRILWLPSLMFAVDGILSRLRDDRRRDVRCRFASIVPCGLPGVMNLLSASRRQALLRSASFCQCIVLWLPSAHVRFIWNLEPLRRSMSVCEYRVLWCLDAPLVLIGNWSLRCDGRCRDAHRRFDNVVS